MYIRHGRSITLRSKSSSPTSFMIHHNRAIINRLIFVTPNDSIINTVNININTKLLYIIFTYKQQTQCDEWRFMIPDEWEDNTWRDRICKEPPASLRQTTVAESDKGSNSITSICCRSTTNYSITFNEHV